MGSYVYSSYLWPAVISTILVASLGWYGWLHRRMAGALPFALGCLFAVVWSVSSMLQTAAVDLNTKILWLQFLTVWQLPVVTAGTCFILQYAGLSRWLTKKTVILLTIPPVVLGGFMVTNDLHHLVWTGFTQVEGNLTPIRGPLNTTALAYSYALALCNMAMLLWLLLKFPRYRRPAILMIAAHVGARFVFEFGLRLGFPSQWNYGPFVLLFLFGIYAIALFGFHVFDPVPVARAAALDQMLEGMIVLDIQGCIVDANIAAQRILGEPSSRLRGRALGAVLPEVDLLHTAPPHEHLSRSELRLGEGCLLRHYVLEATPLKDSQGRDLGQMLLLQDVTEQKAAQERLLDQERMVAILQERERLARELHDGIGQVFGFLSMQAQTVRSRVRAGDDAKADALLSRLAQVAQDAHADVRASIEDLQAASSLEWSFIPSLERYLRGCRTDHGIETELAIASGMEGGRLEPSVARHVFRVVQEAVANAHRHGGATAVSVDIEREDDSAKITVRDDGFGFDATRPKVGRDGHFGLAFMRERMLQVGGHIEIDSRQGEGTLVILKVPLGPREGDGGEGTSG
ncbi:MAG: histidine kinase N-terminal 7TM domain-containing protein [Thermoleophilia bacterium]